MAREITAVTTLRALLRTHAPLHIGGLGAPTGDDAPVARDARDRPILPGTSLAGALRGALGESVDQLDQPASRWGAADRDGLGASRVVVHDAVLSPYRDGPDAAFAALGRRDGVAIDRASGTAADGLIYGREVIPTGWWAPIAVEVHSEPGSEPDDLRLLAQIRRELLDGLWLGARSSRGLGEVRAQKRDISVTQVRYDTPAGYWTTRRAPARVELPAAAPNQHDELDVEIAWRPAGPVVVGSDTATANLGFLPLIEPAVQDGADLVRLVLPGTAIAGALRSRAELICRTLRRADTPDDLTAQLTDSPLVTGLFGAPAGQLGGAWSALRVPDCPSTTTVRRKDWAAATEPTADTRPPVKIRAGKTAQLRRTDHVAIDRWSGGASDGRLFSEYEPHGFAFEPLRLRLRLTVLPEDLRAPATMLLLVTLRELVEGRLPLGTRTQRGYGAVTVTGLRLRGAGLDLTTAGPLDLHTEPFHALRQAWRAYHEVYP